MKRSLFTTLVLPIALSALAGCFEQTDPSSASAVATSDWAATPRIDHVTRTTQGFRISGVTSPQGRVVLRGDGGPAYATGSDDQGRFALAVTKPTADILFAVEAQHGEITALAPYVLLTSHAAGGPIALLSDGAPTQRLDRMGPLDAVDSDGRALLASGRAAAGAVISIQLGDQPPMTATAGRDGRWSALLMSDSAAPIGVMVGERRYAYPGPGTAPAPTQEPGGVGPKSPVLTPSGEGQRVSRRLSASSWQSSWFPTD